MIEDIVSGLEKKDGYNGNRNLKKSGVSINLTAELIDEYIKCRDDVVYFVENYCKIVSKDDGLIPFKPYSFQKTILDTIHANRFVINMLPRQMGKTTVVAAYLLHYLIFNSHKEIGILANKGATAREILSRIKMMYEHLPLWIQPGVDEWAKSYITCGNGSRIIAESTSSDSVRGFSFNIVYLDEFAHVDGQDEFFESTYPVISSGDTTKIIITSTPNGRELFYKIYTEAKEGVNGFVPIRVHWNEHPKRDENWKNITLGNIGPKRFRQEFECEFLGSDGTLISGSVLENLAYKNPIYENENMFMYEKPKEEHIYVLTADVSRGKGLDYSAFSVIDVTEMPYKQVFVFRDNNITPVEYAETIDIISKKYNNAELLIELNDLGSQVADILHMDLENENLIFTENRGRSGKRVGQGFGKTAEKGLTTTKTTKAIGCSNLKLLIEQQQLIINDFKTIQELTTFVKKGSSYSAAMGNHDDLVMTLVIFSWLSTQDYFVDLTDNNTLSKLRDRSEDELLEQMLPFGFHIDDVCDDIGWN